MDFGDTYARFSRDIKRRAWRERLSGLDYDDVVAEMTAALYRACQTYDAASGAFEPYWWSIWLNRRVDLILHAHRRFVMVPVGEDIEIIDQKHHDTYDYGLPAPPKSFEDSEERVWQMIALGRSRTEILTSTGLSKWSYYRLLRSWQTEEVLEALGV